MQLGTFLPKNSLCSIHRALWRVPALSSLSFLICKMGRLRLGRYTTIIRSCNPKFSETDALERVSCPLRPVSLPRSEEQDSRIELHARSASPQRPPRGPSAAAFPAFQRDLAFILPSPWCRRGPGPPATSATAAATAHAPASSRTTARH